MERVNCSDYNICEVNENGKHGPIEANYDPDIRDSHVSVACTACGLTTGYPLPDLEDLEWN